MALGRSQEVPAEVLEVVRGFEAAGWKEQGINGPEVAPEDVQEGFDGVRQIHGPSTNVIIQRISDAQGRVYNVFFGKNTQNR